MVAVQEAGLGSPGDRQTDARADGREPWSAAPGPAGAGGGECGREGARAAAVCGVGPNRAGPCVRDLPSLSGDGCGTSAPTLSLASPYPRAAILEQSLNLRKRLCPKKRPGSAADSAPIPHHLRLHCLLTFAGYLCPSPGVFLPAGAHCRLPLCSPGLLYGSTSPPR